MTWDKFMLNPRGVPSWKATDVLFDRDRGFAHLRKRGERYRWYGDDGRTVGPVHADLQQALEYARQCGWRQMRSA